MRVLITGGAGSGKSRFAERTAAALSGSGPRYYLATMVPKDGEDLERIRAHRIQRAGLGFVTEECAGTLPGQPDPEGTYLLDSTTALLAAAMFGTDSFRYDPDAAERLAGEILAFSQRCRNLVLVSDRIDRDGDRYDPMTEAFREGLSRMDRRFAQKADAAAECVLGCVRMLRGELPGRKRKENGETGMELVIGGAHQGKTEYARNRCGISEEEIFRCGKDGRIDPGYRCIANLEVYAAACAEQGTQPIPPEAFRPDAVLLFTDIFCGVVPAGAGERRDREAAGRYGRLLAAHASRVTRVQFGIPEELV